MGRRLYSIPAGLLVGVLLAFFWPAGAPAIAWVGQVFVSLLKLLILPLILVSIYASLSSAQDLKRIGGGALGLYLLTSAIAATFGTLIGFGYASGVEAGSIALGEVSAERPPLSAERLIASLIPSNLFAALSQGNVLQVVLVAILFALAARRLNETQRQILAAGAQALDALLMQLLSGILQLAPLGVAALVYGSLAGLDWSALWPLRSFVWAVLSAALLHALAALPLLYLLLARRSPWRLALACRAPLFTALATASSSATYPVSKQALEDFGVSERITSLTLPLGAILNMDGSALYQSILLLFMCQLAGIDLSLWQAVWILMLAMASSAGTAGIPGGGIAMMAFMLDLLGLPEGYLALYLLVDRFFDPPITAINVWGDLVVAATLDARGAGAGGASSGQADRPPL